MTKFRKTLVDYIFEPRIFWPEDNYFHSRNREKMVRARRANGLKTQADLDDRIIGWLERRARIGAPSLFAMSTGASGCHYLGSILASRPEYRMIGEIYFPPRLVEIATGLENEIERRMLLDAVSALPAAGGELKPEIIPVNVMHLRPDSPNDVIRQNLAGARFIGLIRNPFHIAISRAFRKEAYRRATNPDQSDRDYAAMQARQVRRFFQMFDARRWDAIIRYEALSEAPLQVAKDCLHLLGLPSTELSTNELAVNNHNTAARPAIEPEIAESLSGILSDTAAAWHYRAPEELLPPKGPGERRWAPMATELETAANIRFVGQGGQLKVATSLPGFCLKELNFDALDKTLEGASGTWKMYFWTLGWLYLVPHLQDPDRGQAYWLGEIIDRAAVWCRNPKDAPERFWDDHATAYRLATLVDIRAQLPPGEDQAGVGSELEFVLSTHIAKLVGFARSDRWAGSNHSVFHALSLLDAALFAEHVESNGMTRERLLSFGLAHLDKALTDMLDSATGISREQSFQYHIWALDLLRGVERFVSDNDLRISFPIAGCYEKMVSFGAYAMVGDEPMPAIGDTPYRATYRRSALDAKARQFGIDPIPSPQELGVGDRIDQLSAVVGADDGLTVMRRHDKSDSARDSLVVFSHFPERKSHGHFDALSVWHTFRGAPLLIDSGGPFAYGMPDRFDYFMDPVAHNCVLVGDASHRGGARLLRQGGSDVARVAHARIDDNSGFSHDRIVHLDAEHVLTIVDVLQSSDGAERDIAMLYHLPPEIEADCVAAPGGALISLGDRALLQIRSSVADWKLDIVEGDGEGRVKGWVTAAQGQKIPAPVSVASCRAAALCAVTTVKGLDGEPARGRRGKRRSAIKPEEIRSWMEPEALVDAERPIEFLLERLRDLSAD